MMTGKQEDGLTDGKLLPSSIDNCSTMGIVDLLPALEEFVNTLKPQELVIFRGMP